MNIVFPVAQMFQIILIINIIMLKLSILISFSVNCFSIV